MKHIHYIDGYLVSCEDEHCTILSNIANKRPNPDISLSSCKQKIEWLEGVNKDLLEACKSVFDWIELYFHYTGIPEGLAQIENKLCKAISKAEGIREEDGK